MRSKFDIDVKTIRKKTGKTQVEFSKAYQIPLGTLRDWEQERVSPDATAQTLLKCIYKDPQVVENLIKQG